MPLTPFGEWRPDVSDYEASTSKTISNVVPRGDGYGPFPSLAALSLALGAACRGAFVAYNSDGSVAIFAGTSTKLYLMDNTTLAWSDVSKASGTYTTLTTSEQWQFVQFNSLVIAVQGNAAPQVYTLGSSSEFADLAGSPPQAKYIAVVGRFVVLSGLTSLPYRIQWSGLNSVNASNSWTSGTNFSDYQDFPDGGPLRGVAGGENGVIFQDKAIRRMIYVPGSAVVFQIERIEEDIGLYGPYSIVRSGTSVFFYSSQGFKRVDPSGFPVPIGKERVDRTFGVDLDKSNLQLFVGVGDPRNQRVFWAYKSANGTSGLFDKLLCYDKVLDRFTTIAISGEYPLSVAQPGITLESLDTISSSIDALTTSLDDYSTSIIPELAAFDSTHKLNFFRGSNLEATLQSAEQGTDGRRIKVRGFRPVTDATTLYGSLSKREVQANSVSTTDEIVMNATTGRVDRVASTRYCRAIVRIPSGTTWTYIAGVEMDMSLEGTR